MGIEDFSVDSNKHSQRILVVGQDNETGSALCRLLGRRNYGTFFAVSPEEAAKIAVRELFDLIIIDHQQNTSSPQTLINKIRSDLALRRFPLLLICPAATALDSLSESEQDIQVLRAPFEPSGLLVKVATQLRMRKFKYEQAGFEARVAAQNAELRDLTARYQQELLEARQIQHAILPRALPTAPKTMVCAYYAPLEAVGGDLFDAWKISSHVLGLFIADVTGHGLPAAFIGAMTKMALAYAPKDNPGNMLRHMNDGLSPLIPEGRFVTAAAAFYDYKTGQLSVARAGHPAAYLWHKKEQAVESISPKGLPLGIASGTAFLNYETTLEPGDKFLMVTDGLTETPNMDGVLWGAGGVANEFAHAASLASFESCLSRLIDRQNAYAAGRIIRDDVTMIGLERRE